MTATLKKGKKQVRVYLEKDDERTLTDLLKLFGGRLTDTDVTGLILNAAMNAIREHHGPVCLPIRFSIPSEPAPLGVLRLNEPKPAVK